MAISNSNKYFLKNLVFWSDLIRRSENINLASPHACERYHFSSSSTPGQIELKDSRLLWMKSTTSIIFSEMLNTRIYVRLSTVSLLKLLICHLVCCASLTTMYYYLLRRRYPVYTRRIDETKVFLNPFSIPSHCDNGSIQGKQTIWMIAKAHRYILRSFTRSEESIIDIWYWMEDAEENHEANFGVDPRSLFCGRLIFLGAESWFRLQMIFI